jgi:hypothetical protein
MAGQNWFGRQLYRLLPSAARTTHPVIPNINVGNARGIKFYIDITAWSGTGIVFTVSHVDPITSTSSATVLASASKAATGAFTLTIMPGVGTVANVALNDVVPRTLKLVTSGTITSVTYSVAYELFD